MIKTYLIKNEKEEVINTVVSSLNFVEKNFKFFEEVKPTKGEIEAKEIMWRDEELKETDWIIPVIDHSQHEEYLVYRQALRDWTATEDFPDTRPTLGI